MTTRLVYLFVIFSVNIVFKEWELGYIAIFIYQISFIDYRTRKIRLREIWY